MNLFLTRHHYHDHGGHHGNVHADDRIPLIVILMILLKPTSFLATQRFQSASISAVLGSVISPSISCIAMSDDDADDADDADGDDDDDDHNHDDHDDDRKP